MWVYKVYYSEDVFIKNRVCNEMYGGNIDGIYYKLRNRMDIKYYI
ncbi:protein of unknown function [Clostridium beijerinckii]|nr:protein of unknown function [Clostridium beijerinckii]